MVHVSNTQRCDTWKVHYLKLSEFKRRYGTAKVSPAEDETLFLWCSKQRKKRKEKHPLLTEDKIMLLDDIGFVWENEGYSRNSSSRKAIQEIARHKTSNHEHKSSSESNDLDIDMIDSKNHDRENAPPQDSPAQNQSSVNEVKYSQGGLDHATVEVDETCVDHEDKFLSREAEVNTPKEEIKVPVPIVKPNLEFIRRSIDGAVWLAQGASDLVKIFVSF